MIKYGDDIVVFSFGIAFLVRLCYTVSENSKSEVMKVNKEFGNTNWQSFIPMPVCEACPEYEAFYIKAFLLAREHVKYVDGMPQNPYMDEGFCDTQIWIWDTAFMSLFTKFAREVFPGVESFQNFYEVLFRKKSLPAVIPKEDEPDFTGAIPGIPFNIQVHIADNPPLFAFAEYENALFSGDKERLRKILYEENYLVGYYNMLESLSEYKKLTNVNAETRWISEPIGYRWEGGRSGMDNTPRGRIGKNAEKDRPAGADVLWIDAICEQALAAKKISELFRIIEDFENEKLWLDKYREKRELVNSLYWDSEDGFYYDIDVNDRHFYKVRTIASYWALTAEIATEEQAEKMLSCLFDENDFGGEMPLVSLSRSDADFSENGRYWRGSVWLPTAYAALKGIANYGYYKEAHILAKKLLSHMYKTYEEYEPHTIWECYSPSECKPATEVNGKTVVRPDFCGWSALGPISIFIEYVLGFHKINAFENSVEWEKPCDMSGKIGIRNLRFGNVVTDIIADGSRCTVTSNREYTLKVNGKAFEINMGENHILL